MERPVFGPAGTQFWDAVHVTFGFSDSEAVLLEQACRRLDIIADLDAAVAEHGVMVLGSKGQVSVNPAVSESRGQCLVLHRLLAALAIPDVDGKSIPSARSAITRVTRAAQRAQGPVRSA